MTKESSVSNKSLRFLIVSGEVSGDIYCSRIIDEVRKITPNVEFFGVGGNHMAEKKVNLLYSSSQWSSIGYIESWKKVPKLYFVYLNLCQIMQSEKVDLLICIDFPGFNMRLVRYAKQIGIPSVYLFPPAKFSKNPDDVRDAAMNITQVCASFKRTCDVYKKASANVEFVGHPIIDTIFPPLDHDAFLRQYGVHKGSKVVALLPGSRFSEIDHILPILLDAARIIHHKFPNTHFIVPLLGKKYGGDVTYGKQIEDYCSEHGLAVSLSWDSCREVLRYSDCAVVTSGTATLEAGFLDVPMVIVYKVSAFTAFIARIFNRIPEFIGLPNLILGKRVVPELVQDELNPDSLSREIESLLSSKEKCKAMKKGLSELKIQLGEKGVSARVAQLILQTAEEGNNPDLSPENRE